MVSTFTPNLNLEEPARGDYVGTWDLPVNSNTSLIDLVAGAVVGITLNNSPVVLAAGQFQSAFLVFISTLTGSVAITFPTSFKKPYFVRNACTGSSAFTISLQTTAAGGTAICVPPSDTVQIYNDGSNINFLNLGRIGTYWDYGGSSVPNWVSGCSVPPYLNCDGTAFSSATYPVLNYILGGTTLPDRRGTAGYALNQGTGRLTVAAGGLDGDTKLATKLTDSVTIGTSNLPAYTPAATVSVVSNVNSVVKNTGAITSVTASGGVFGAFNDVTAVSMSAITSSGSITGTPQGGVSDPTPAIGTGTVYGITMIRAG